MCDVIMVTSGKGGVGKSTVAVALAHAFSSLNRKTVIVELDVGLRGLDLMLGVEDKAVFDLGDLLTNRCSIQDALIEVNNDPNLSVVVAPAVLKSTINYNDIALLCRGLSNYFDHVIVDAPAGIGVSLLLAPKIADMVIVVATPDSVCVRDGGKLVQMLEKEGVKSTRLLINKVDAQKPKTMEIFDLDKVIDGVGAQLIGVVPIDTDLSVAMLSTYRPKNCRAYRIFQNIAGRLLGEYIDLEIQ